jgi:hypothetical protein
VAKILIPAIIIMSFCSCVPARYTYYEPIAKDGRLYNSIAGSVAPKDTIEFSANGVTIGIEGAESSVYMIVKVPKGEFASFESDEVELLDADKANKITFPFRVGYYDPETKQSAYLRPRDVMVGGTRKGALLAGPKPRIFEIRVKFGETHRDHYYVKIPSLKTNKQTLEIPMIEFIRKESLAVFPVNG